MNKQAVLAIDLGGSKLIARIKTPTSIIDYKVFLPNDSNFKQDLQLLTELASNILDKVKKESLTLRVIALAAAPNIDNGGVVTSWPNRSFWVNNNIKTILTNLFNCPILIEDDGNAAALAEAQAWNIDHLIYIGIGTGVGGGVIYNQQIMHGQENPSFEVGHISVYPNGVLCKCGKYGCLQAYCSANAIFTAAGIDYKNHLSPLKELRKAIIKNDEAAHLALDKAANCLAIALDTLIELFSPKIIILGGGMGVGFPELIQSIYSKLKNRSRFLISDSFIKLAKHGANSSLIGAEIIASRYE